jgi:hypothetical protein
MGTRVLVVTQDDYVFNHDVRHGPVGISFLLGQVPSYTNDKVFVVLGQHIFAVRGNGYVDAYPAAGNSIQSGHRLGPMPGPHQPLVAMTWDARQIFAHPMTNQLLVTRGTTGAVRVSRARRMRDGTRRPGRLWVLW